VGMYMYEKVARGTSICGRKDNAGQSRFLPREGRQKRDGRRRVMGEKSLPWPREIESGATVGARKKDAAVPVGRGVC